MSLFKKIANFCRNSNDRADERNRNYNNSSSGSSYGWRLEACSTCYYLRETDSIENVYHPYCHYCEKKRVYFSDNVIGNQKCDKYIEE